MNYVLKRTSSGCMVSGLEKAVGKKQTSLKREYVVVCGDGRENRIFKTLRLSRCVTVAETDFTFWVKIERKATAATTFTVTTVATGWCLVFGVLVNY